MKDSKIYQISKLKRSEVINHERKAEEIENLESQCHDSSQKKVHQCY